MNKNKYIIGIAHIGIAVPNLNEAKKLYENLGYELVSDVPREVEKEGVRTLFLRMDTMNIELLEPLHKGESSPIDAYIKTKPYKMYHIAYDVSDINAQIKLMESQKYIKVDEPKEVDGKKTVFMFNRKMGLVELVEKI